jgi:hypothetical protein
MVLLFNTFSKGFVMSKYLSLLLILALAWSMPAFADDEYDEEIDIPEREAAKLLVCDTAENYFDGQNVIEILQQAQTWLNDYTTYGEIIVSDGSNFSAEGVDPADITNFMNASSFWIDLLSNTDGLELTAMGLGADQYMTNRYGEDTGELHDDLPPAEDYGHLDDLEVENTVTLGRYFGRSNTDWSGDYNQIKFVAEQTEYVFYAAATQTPIVMDMDNDGKLEASNGQFLPHKLAVPKDQLVEFDMSGDGFKELTEWIGKNDALLVENYEGADMSAANLFSNEGGKYKNGYEKLALRDKDKNGYLTGDELAGLGVWQDNGNAKVDDGEIKTVQELKITRIDVTHKNLISSFVQDGTRKPMWDWHPATFMVKKSK